MSLATSLVMQLLPTLPGGKRQSSPVQICGQQYRYPNMLREGTTGAPDLAEAAQQDVELAHRKLSATWSKRWPILMFRFRVMHLGLYE